LRTAANPHWFVANSENVRRRIRDIYGREAEVIYPPVQAAAMELSERDDGYFLMVTAMVPYKRVVLAVEAFTRTNRQIVGVGDGPESGRLRREAGPTVSFKGWLPDAEVRALYAGCSGVVFPGAEDFGIVPVEAMAAGKPVVAFAQGGALETVVEGRELATGVLFTEQTADALIAAVERCRNIRFDREAMRRFALSFDRERYKDAMAAYVERRLRGHKSAQPYGTKEVIGPIR
ncbi:MAG: glycosyltransferase, partial [Acidobacteria bacterium]